jgi:small-conductance mechanosensitive channel
LQSIRNLLKALVFFGLILGLFTPTAAQTQTALQQTQSQNAVTAAVTLLQEQVKAVLEKAAVSLTSLRRSVDDATSADGELAQRKLQIDALGKTIADAIAQLENRYNLVAKRLEDLGNPPAEGQPPESAATTNDRKRLQGEKAEMNTILSDADVLSKQASDLSDHVTDLRRKLFTETLFRYTEVNGQLLDDTVEAWRQQRGQFWVRAGSALDFTWRFKRQGFFLALGLIALAAFVIIALVRRMFGPFIHRDASLAQPTFTHRLVVAFWSTLLPTLAAGLFVLVSLISVVGLRVIREDIVDVVRSVLWTIVGLYFVWRLARAIVAPAKPQWRLVNVSDHGARVLVAYAVLLALVNGLAYVGDQANIALDAPVILTVAEGFVSSIVIGVILIFLSFVRPMVAGTDGRGAWPRPIRLLLILMGVGLILTTLFGYIGLAQFAASQIVVTGALLVTMYIGIRSGQAISRPDAFGKTLTGRYLQRRYQISTIRLDQIGLIAGLVIYVVVCLFGIPSIMLKWGFRSVDIWTIFIRLFTEIHVGNISISLLGIFAGILVFAGGYFATRWFQSWLDGTVMARSQVDIGVRNSVSTVLGYAGIFIAGLIGISAAGINLSSLALVAGALSLGIGFGLQTIVQNFVSGLILLIERPFRVGDWIVNGPVEGFVRRISVRATEIETFRNQSVIVPNSQLINASVGNWTLRNKLGRSEIPVSVAYGSDPRRVMDILMEIASRQPLVLTMPEPHVEFVRFGESSLDFELRFYLADLFTGMGVRNDIRIEILERFREEGIRIPYPQRTVHVHTADEGMIWAAAEKAESATGEEHHAREELDRRRKSAEANARDIDSVEDNRHSHDRYDHDDGDDGDDSAR